MLCFWRRQESWLFDEGMGIGREGDVIDSGRDVLRGRFNTIEKMTPDVSLSSCSVAHWRRRRWIFLRLVF